MFRFGQPLRALVLLGAMLLAACGQPEVSSVVTRFHALPNNPPAGLRFAIAPVSRQQAESLEYQRYADLVAAELQGYGLAEVPQSAGPQWIVNLRFGTEGPRTEFEGAAHPGWTFGVGSYVGRGGIGVGSHFPLGHDPYYRTQPVYTRWIAMDIFDSASLAEGQRRKLFEGRAVSEGPTPVLPEIMPAMVDALFKDFPGRSGASQVVRVPLVAEP